MVDKIAEGVDGQALAGSGFLRCGRRAAGGLDGRVWPCFGDLGVVIVREG